MKRLHDYFTLGTLGGLTGVQVPDKTSLFGVIGTLNNASAYCGHMETIVSTGTNNNISAAQIRRRVLRYTTGASGGFTLTLPTTSAIIASLGPTMIYDGTYGQEFNIMNDGTSQTATLTAGDASTTITGTATIANNITRRFFMMLTSSTTVTYFNIGTLTV